MKSINIFISYRRNDSAGHARSLYEKLDKDFEVFFDTENIEYGDKFPESIQKGLEKADVVLVVLADDADYEFKWRLDKGIKDYVALEIEYAEQLNKDIIPITINTVDNMPNVSSLPKEIEFFPTLNAYTVRHDKFSTDIVGLKNRIREKHFQLYAWHIILALLIILGTIFAFEKPREFVVDIKDEIIKKINEKPKKKYAFSLTDNLSPYSLMPNPTFEEWKRFSKSFNQNSKESYKKFINIKNRIEENNLLKPSYSPTSSSSSTTISLDDNIVTHKESHSGNSSTLSTSILRDLLELKDKSPNALVDYYIGIIKLNFGNNEIEELKDSLKNIKNQKYDNYAYDLEQISIVIQDKNLSKINKNNHLLNPQYYLDLNITDKLTDITLLEEMDYTLASYNIIVQDSNLSNEQKIDAVKSFLKKDKKFQKRNGYLVLTTYINFFNEKNKRKILRLIKKYPMDIKYKTYLLTLLGINKYIDLEEFNDILDYEDEFFDDIDVKTTHLKEKLIEIKKAKKDISNIFDFFYKKETLFNDTLKIVRLSKRILEKKEECVSESNLISKSFLLYIQSLNDLDNEEPILYLKYQNNFYNTHQTNYTLCIQKNQKLPLEIDSFTVDVKLLKTLFDAQLDTMIEDMNRRKKQNMLISRQDEQQMKLINTLIQCVQNRDSCENLMELAPAFDNLIDNFLKDFFSDEDMPIIVTNISDTIERIYERNREDILIGKLPLEEFTTQFSNEFKVLMNDTPKLDKNSCYFLYAYEEFSNQMDDDNLSIDKLFGDSYKKLCTPYKVNYTQGRDFIVHFISQTIYADSVKDINISTDIRTLNKIASQYDLKLFNLLSHSFYDEDIIYLKRRINLYKYQYDSSLVNFFLLNYFLFSEDNLKKDRYIMLVNEIYSLREGEYIYNFNLNKKIIKELGYINLLYFKPLVKSSWWGISWSSEYTSKSFLSNRPTLSIKIEGNIKNLLDFIKMVRYIKQETKKGVKSAEIIKLLKQNYSNKRLSTLLKFYINDIWGKDKIWAYHELIKSYKELAIKDKEYMGKEQFIYEKLADLYLERKEYMNAIKYSKINLNSFQDRNQTDFISYQYLHIGTLYRLNNEENLSKVYYQKSKDSYLKWMDRNASDSYPYTNLFRLSLIQDEVFDENLEKEFIKRFKDDNETFIYYEARKILSNVSFGKDFNLRAWFNKYRKVPIEKNWFHVNAWIETKQDFIEKYNLIDAVTLFKTHLDFEKAIENYSDKIKELEDNNDSNTSKGELVRNYREIGFVYGYMGQTNLEIENLYKTIEIEESMIPINKVNLAMDYYRLSQIYYNKKDYKHLQNIYEKIIELTKDLEGQKNLYLIYGYLANLSSGNSEFKKSNEYLNEAIVRAKKKFQKNKNNFELNNKLYDYYILKIKNYQKLNQLDKGSIELEIMIKFLKEIPNISLTNLQKIAYEHSKNLLEYYNLKGNNYKKEKQTDGAILNYINGLKIFTQFSNLDSNNTTWQNEIFSQQIKIADNYKEQKKHKESLIYYKDSIGIIHNLYDKNSSYLTWQLNLSLVYNRISGIYMLEKKPIKALNNYLKAYNILNKALKLNPSNKELNNWIKSSSQYINKAVNLSITVANSLQRASKFDEVIGLYEDAIQKFDGYKEESFKNYVAQFHINKGSIYNYKKEFKKALEDYNQTVLIREFLYNKNTKNRYFKRKLHNDYERVANLFKFKFKNLNKSKEFYQKALNVFSCTHSFLNLYELQIITNKDINQTFETVYIKRFKDKKTTFIDYEMLKIIKNITNKKEVNIKAWKNKYKSTSLSWSWKELDSWVKTIKDNEIRVKIIEAIDIFKEHQKLNKQ